MTDKKTDSMVERFRQLPSSVRKGLTVFFGLCGLLVLLDLVVAKHGEHWWTFFGFTCLFGFVACVILVLIASWMRKPLMRDEQYYDRSSETQTEPKPK